MELRQLSGNTYAIETDTSSIGLYIFNDQRCLLIDSGANQTQAQELWKLLKARNLTVYAIFNTHSHADHCGGNHYIQARSNCRIYATAVEAAFIQQPILIPYALYGAFPLKLLQSKFFMPQASHVTDTISAGYMPINGQAFEILDLGGHTLGHLGIRTPDNVVFVGDSLIPIQILHTNPFLYLADPKQQIQTIEKIRADNSPLLYLSHGGISTDIPAVINANYDMMMLILVTLKQIIHAPRNQEEIIHEVIARHGLEVNRNHYFRLAASISAFLAYLCNDGQATVSVSDHNLQYCSKS
jgi:glyoxylase-like metal-dependent hydrolase (beta-lactamase superfamily II)